MLRVVHLASGETLVGDLEMTPVPEGGDVKMTIKDAFAVGLSRAPGNGGAIGLGMSPWLPRLCSENDIVDLTSYGIIAFGEPSADLKDAHLRHTSKLTLPNTPKLTLPGSF
jgi:hypothetical protein